MTEDEILDLISGSLRLESWFEGKTLTVMLKGESNESHQFVKLRLVGVTNKPSAADLRGEL
jgi:hypothetical protein